MEGADVVESLARVDLSRVCVGNCPGHVGSTVDIPSDHSWN